jgi:gluconate 2-dehydrogenase gamma chain
VDTDLKIDLPEARVVIDREQVATSVSRREFVGVAALSAVWLAAGAGCKRMGDASHETTALVHFSPAQAAQVEAIASRIIPTDDTPGAREAGVIHFIDQSLTGFAKEQAPLFAAGLTSLGETVTKRHGSAATFAALTAEQQDALLREIEKTEFFGAMRFATIAGFLALPKYGGNKDYIGWKFIGQEMAMEHSGPFGWYDRPENQMALLGRVL